MARPPLSDDEKPVIVQLKLRLYRGRHDTLINFFERVPDRLRSISAIQAMLGSRLDEIKIDDLPSDDDIEAAFDALMSG